MVTVPSGLPSMKELVREMELRNGLYSLPGFAQPMSSLSHLCGAIIFAILSYYLLQPVWRERGRFWCLAVFAFSAVLLLSLSSVFHMFAPGTRARAIMIRLDVAAIFVLIAGSFTVIHGILFRGWRRWGILVLIWSIAIAGITIRTLFFDSIPKSAGIFIFLMMGWIGIFTAYLLYQRNGIRPLVPVVAGGIIYTIGALSNLTNWPTVIPYVWSGHETFHYAVLGGLACHWWLAVQIAEGRVGRPKVEHLSQPAAETA